MTKKVTGWVLTILGILAVVLGFSYCRIYGIGTPTPPFPYNIYVPCFAVSVIVGIALIIFGVRFIRK